MHYLVPARAVRQQQDTALCGAPGVATIHLQQVTCQKCLALFGGPVYLAAIRHNGARP